MEKKSIQSVLFCCNYNSVRSPMAEGILKKLIGRKIFVQSAGIFDTIEIDGYTVRVCNEINVKLSKHRVRSLSAIERQGGFVGSFDLVISLTKESAYEVKKFSKYHSVAIECWNVDEPLKFDNNVQRTLDSYRYTRDVILEEISCRFREYLP